MGVLYRTGDASGGRRLGRHTGLALLVTALLSLGTACGDRQPDLSGYANVAPARVTEALTGDGRSYLRIEEADWDFWVSVPEQAVDVGDYVLLGQGPERRDHRSEALDRSFPSLIWIERVQVVDEATAQAAIRLSPPRGGLSIEQVFAERADRADTEVQVRGRIVKASYDIFETNWYHLQDGSGRAEDENHDLTITSDTRLEVGQVVTAAGTLTTDKDLGFGYFYAAIIEGAAVSAE